MTSTTPAAPQPQPQPSRVQRMKAWWGRRTRPQKVGIITGAVLLLIISQCDGGSDDKAPAPAPVDATPTAPAGETTNPVGTTGNNDADHINDMDRIGAMALCKQQLKARADQPKSVDFERYDKNKDVAKSDDQLSWITDIKFTARNAFGQDMPHEGRCIIYPDNANAGRVTTLVDDEILTHTVEQMIEIERQREAQQG